MRKRKKSPSRNLKLVFIFSVAGIILITLLIVILLSYMFSATGLITPEILESLGWVLVLGALLSSILIGLGLASLFGKLIMKPINNMVDGMVKLSEGEYQTRIDLGNDQSMKRLADCFNKLAIDLQNTEIFRTDFINNFSHELKTPIVSINGLVSLLKNSNLPIEKQKEYLSIIEEETQRLTTMTTNVLNLSKLENIEIITDKEYFNLSEQIRTCVLLLEKKWLQKKITLSLDFKEYKIYANQDLLRQVWFNILDNAIKFSYEKKELKVTIDNNKNQLVVKINNIGPTISKDDQEKIFNKFYQIDKTHSKEGNGIGLSICKRIITLHQGSIEVESENENTTFIISLPID